VVAGMCQGREFFKNPGTQHDSGAHSFVLRSMIHPFIDHLVRTVRARCTPAPNRILPVSLVSQVPPDRSQAVSQVQDLRPQ
jgi:hypothetical protein